MHPYNFTLTRSALNITDGVAHPRTYKNTQTQAHAYLLFSGFSMPWCSL